ncbi:MAG: DUF1080 domain-containing protein [Saprospiraceae bacterium]|nr:DUF1080 domain-containing protein [Saprospiraceae bacterium]
MFRKIILSACVIIFLMACNRTENIIRPMSPWVFRSVLDKTPRMITMALNKDMFASFNTQTCALYKVWRGGVDLDGAVYTTHHGPQPTSFGKAYLVNEIPEPWSVQQNGQSQPVKVAYKGHKFEKGRVTLLYEMKTPDKKVIHVEESPEFLKSELEQYGFERKFNVTGLPADSKLVLNTNINSIASKENIVTQNVVFELTKSAPHKSENFEYFDMYGKLLLNNGASSYQVYFIKTPTIDNPNDEAFATTEITAEDIMASSDCATCHNPTKYTVGPSFTDIAKKYPKTQENTDHLANKIIKGGEGVWGKQAMTAHPNISKDDAKKLVEFIMNFDETKAVISKSGDATSVIKLDKSANLKNDELFPGAIIKVYQYKKDIIKVADLATTQAPIYAGISNNLSYNAIDMKGLESNFAIISQGYFYINNSNNFVFRLTSDDGSQLTIDGKVVISNDGLHGMDGKDGEVTLSEGFHNFKIEYFNGYGGKGLSVQWRSFDDAEFFDIPADKILHSIDQQKGIENKTLPIGTNAKIPGDAFPLAGVHPSFDLAQARPNIFAPKVGGMDFLSDGRLVVCTWDKDGAVYIVENATSGNPKKMRTKKIAEGLAEPLGLKVVKDNIYVLQKQELTKLVDNNHDDVIDEYQSVCNGWTTTANFHEFAFGLVYKNGYFYAALATAIQPGGASARPQAPDRGKVIKISEKDGTHSFVAQGLRTPNGIGIGVDGEIFVADNQGDWLPSCKIMHVKPNAFFGSFSVDSIAASKLPVQQPVVWLPQDEIGNSTTEPTIFKDGIYKGQMVFGDLTNGGLKRMNVEKVNGDYQGCAFHFCNGLEAGVNRLTWGPDGGLYIGGIGSTGNWQDYGKLWYGLQRLKFNNKVTFEPLAIRAKSNGFEIEFTEPIKEGGEGTSTDDYEIKQWWYKPTKEYGGPKMDEEYLNIKSVTMSDDRKKVFLEVVGMKPQHVVYLHIKNSLMSINNNELWVTEGYYTLNNIPQEAGTVSVNATFAENTLTPEEVKNGWKLLFDGKTLNGIRNFKKKTVGSSWVVDEGSLHLNAEQRNDGGWQAKDGGDIIVTDKEYENYEFKVEWKINNCGNSGIIYNVIENEHYDYVWQTGPEMQVLDNICHPDAKFEKHRAGDLYDLIACKYVTVKPAGQWNKAMVRVKNGKLEHWLNGRKVVATTMWTHEWDKLVQGSKFKDMPGFGTGHKGHIALQDHGDKVWFRNIKIRELKK